VGHPPERGASDGRVGAEERRKAARPPGPSPALVDFLFPAQRLIVEADSWTYHRTRRRFERDRRRDVAHTLAGYRTLRFPDRDLEREPKTVAQTVRTALGEERAASSQGP